MKEASDEDTATEREKERARNVKHKYKTKHTTCMKKKNGKMAEREENMCTHLLFVECVPTKRLNA